MADNEIFIHLDSKLDLLMKDVTDVKVDLKDHMRRTLAAEQSIELLRRDFAPLKTHVAVVGALAKGIGLLGAMVGIVTGLMKLLGVL